MEVIEAVERMIDEYPVTEFLNERRLERQRITTSGGGASDAHSNTAHLLKHTGGAK